MASRIKPAPEPEPAHPGAYRSIPGVIGEWVRQGTEGFIATQKIMLDLAAQQNALALTIVRERLGTFTFGPAKPLADLASKGIHNFMEAQRMLIDLAAQQNKIVEDGFKPAVAQTAISPVAEVVHKGLHHFFVAQKRFLGVFEAQAEAAIKDLNERKGFDTGRLGKVAKEAVHDFIVTQKQFLDLVQEQIDGKDGDAQPSHKRVDVFEMAKKSVDSFVEAEKRMLDLVSTQVDVDVKFVREVFNTRVSAKPPTSVPELMKKSVDSFVAAQKALVELASKSRNETEADLAQARHATA